MDFGNMRVSLIGPGDVEFHFQRLLNIPKIKFERELKEIAQILVNSQVELEILPDKGVSLEIAKIYKQLGGGKVIATIPKSDKEIGIKHLEPYLKTQVDNKLIFEEIIDSGDWFKHDLTKALFSDVVLYLGYSPGTEIERNGAEYLYKFLKFVKIHSKIKAGKNYTIFVYSPFLISGKLPKEAEVYLEKDNINLVYVQNPKELEKKLKEFIQYK